MVKPEAIEKRRAILAICSQLVENSSQLIERIQVALRCERSCRDQRNRRACGTSCRGFEKANMRKNETVKRVSKSRMIAQETASNVRFR